MYNLPFVQGQTIIELGGGNNPLIRPNFDIRKFDNVDYVVDFNKNLPLNNDSIDGIYCKYAIEHISWRSVKQFISETYRILKPGGRVVFITANLLEQAKILANLEEYEDRWICMIFGDCDYPENSHKCGFSPESVFRTFSEIGFEDITIFPHPEWKADMIIEAKKGSNKEIIKPETWTKQDRQQAYDMKYFDGGGKYGGYAREGYWDYPAHYLTAKMILDHKPESVLELGPARGYVLKKIEDSGVRVGGLEVSRHCILTRVCDNIIQCDITETPWPIHDNAYDMIFSSAVFEHLPEDKIELIVAEMKRVAKRGLIGISFKDDDDGFDKTHATLKDIKWWTDRIPKEFIVVDKEDLERGEIPIPQTDGKLKLNIGSFTTMFHHGWTNIDIHDLDGWAKKYMFKYVRHDIRNGLPYNDNTVDMIYSCHMLEHISSVDAQKFLNSCYRVMKLGGVMRLILPDAKKLIMMYLNDTIKSFDDINEGCFKERHNIGKLFSLLVPGHLAFHDIDSITEMLQFAGFTNIINQTFRQCVSRQIMSETIDLYPELSLFIDVTK